VTRFAGMKQQAAAKAVPPPESRPDPGDRASRAVKPREGKKAVSAYFSPDVSRGLHMLALEQGVSMQALLGEAIDDIMRKHGKHPFGER